MKEPLSATWYRSPMRLKGDSIVPSEPFEPYDPFSRYYPFGSANRDQSSLYIEFLNVDSQDPGAVVNFCERFGVLGVTRPPFEERKGISSQTFSPNFPFLFSKLNPKSSYTKERLRTAVKFYKKPSTKFPSEMVIHGVKIPTSLLYSPVSPPGMKKVEVDAWMRTMESYYKKAPQYLVDLLKAFFGSDQPGGEYRDPMFLSGFQNHQLIMKETLRLIEFNKSSPLDKHLQMRRDFIATVINCSVAVIPKIRWDGSEGSWSLGWGATSLITLLWTMFMLDLAGPGRFLSCPRCGKFFLGTSLRVRFCSEQCNDVYKVQQYNLRKAAKEKLALKKKRPQKTLDLKTRRRGR